ncbi:hypothetical protein Z959_04015 [Clostridium novyi B str. ATCC 27606]|uniref:Uncharacterized protein n=3 Tax=Clostridiaceae TaxID=31979 RepID=A0AA40IS68_CLONO|nr:hypothetical protein Z958_10645 [Clostridium novyi B str. NCTC 9691]KEI12602.1 hypothetical protein Z959_04015 [Clostridium novyi B str. ATCC 27606]KEI17248.1 hypothetical protein Z960_06915 [Clostridium haemolyticum NCTC 9693]KGN04906.1 hypothetical protein Z961_00415 [Clostridium haemolyticum NCTC 8350]
MAIISLKERRDIMSNKKVFMIFSSILISITLVLGYYIGKNTKTKGLGLYNNKGKRIVAHVTENEKESQENLKKVLKSNTDIFFEIYVKSDNSSIMLERNRKAKDEKLEGKTVAEIKEKYKSQGYILRSIRDDRIELVRKSNKYKPNRYVLLAENNEIVIAKSDNKGNVFDKKGNILDKEGTGANVNYLRDQEIDKLVKGDDCMQFASIDQLNNGIMSFDIKYEMPE